MNTPFLRGCRRRKPRGRRLQGIHFLGVMTRASLAVAVTLMSFSCGLEPSGSDERLKVTNTLRDACESFGLADTVIGLLLQITEEDRLSGLSKEDNIADTLDSCSQSSTPDLVSACETCTIAIIEQVYAE